MTLFTMTMPSKRAWLIFRNVVDQFLRLFDQVLGPYGNKINTKPASQPPTLDVFENKRMIVILQTEAAKKKRNADSTAHKRPSHCGTLRAVKR